MKSKLNLSDLNNLLIDCNIESLPVFSFTINLDVSAIDLKKEQSITMTALVHMLQLF